jgi:hypothetical protein
VKRVIDDTIADLLATVRAAEAQHKPKRQRSKLQSMSKPDRERYLRSRGWRRLSTSGSQQWTDGSGTTATLSGAVALQLERDA